MTTRITISAPDELADQINSQLSYGDNRSEWIRDAIEEKLARDTQPDPEPRPVAQPEPDVEPAPRPEPADVDLPEAFRESIDRTPARDEALRVVYGALRNAGELTKQEILTYYDGEATELAESSWYERLVSPELRRLPGVEPPQPGAGTWRYVGNGT